MTYVWNCNGGTLSNSKILQPIFTAPIVSSVKNYTCTLTVTDSKGKTDSSEMRITISPISIVSPVVNAGPSKSVESSKSVRLEGNANHPDNLGMTYYWKCNGGSLTSSNVLWPIFNAPSVNLITVYSCTLTATDTKGRSSSSTTYITVSPIRASLPGFYSPSVVNNNSSSSSAGSTTYVYVYPN
jgi:hypothetical protein